MLIPTKEQVSRKHLDEVLQAFAIESSKLNMRRPNEFVRGLTAKLRIPFLDLLPVFEGATASPFFDYDEHLTPLGHRLTADALARQLTPMAGPSQVRLLSTEFAGDRYPTASQDGSLLAYQSFRDGNMELFLAHTKLGSRRRLTFNDVDESHPMLSRDGSQILFTQGQSQESHVVLMNVDGSQRTVITSGPNIFGAIPALSRANLMIAYAEWSRIAGRTFSMPQIVVLDVVSGQKRHITPANRESWRPIFAPDGTQVFYISKVTDQFDIYAYDLVSNAERQITFTSFDEWDPQIAANGTQLVYAAHTDDNWDLFLRDFATGLTRRLTQTKGDEWDPSFSHDDTSLLFAGRFGLMEAIFAMPLAP
jgi:Tol biopolymer transport system component